MLQDEPLAEFTSEEFDSELEIILALLRNRATPDQFPKGYVLGGQPGSGKTTLHGIIMDNVTNNISVINGDDFRRHHPNFRKLLEKYGKDWVDYTNAFSGKMTEAIISRLSQLHYNLIVEGTLRTTSVPISTCKLLKQQGYSVELCMMAVKPEISYSSTILRYEQMISRGLPARATPRDKHDGIVHSLAENLNQIDKLHLFDNITIYNREKQCLYDQRISRNRNPAAILDQVLTGFWSPEERDSLLQILNDAQKLMERRSALEFSDFAIYRKNLIDRVDAAAIRPDSLKNRLRAAQCKSDKIAESLLMQRPHEIER